MRPRLLTLAAILAAALLPAAPAHASGASALAAPNISLVKVKAPLSQL